MPDVQKKKLNTGTVIALIFLAAIIGISFLKISIWIKLAADAVLILAFIFIRRGYIFLSIGAMNFKKGNFDKAWNNLEKALKAGLDPERRNMVGSAYIQQGDPSRGVQILESVAADPKAGDNAKVAVVTCSMGYWRLGEKEKAVSSLEELRATGYKNDNLSINLETYLLEMGELKRAKDLITENRKEGTENNGLLDNRGWYYILTGSWKKAKEVFDELIDERNAKFPEAYLHGAQVSIHDGDLSQAVDRLGWGASKKFTSTCMSTKAYFDKLLLGLENPATREAFAKAMDEHCKEVSLSQSFTGLEDAVDFDHTGEGVLEPSEKPSYLERQNAASDTQGSGSAAVLLSSDEKQDINTDIDDDDREPNTDLDDDDAAFAVEHGYALSMDDYSDDEDPDMPDTSVYDDDDDREPNTDLDEKDR
ncbi:MAG: hypothetical protein ILP16_01350 [Spirochaetales bacterium]|nr:hypothetical protein [Spirochaetales bacterium]